MQCFPYSDTVINVYREWSFGKLPILRGGRLELSSSFNDDFAKLLFYIPSNELLLAD